MYEKYLLDNGLPCYTEIAAAIVKAIREDNQAEILNLQIIITKMVDDDLWAYDEAFGYGLILAFAKNWGRV